ncbi:MAG: hypothetical protein V1678_01255 [Candidatus Aenigmatarchaeota archaeon]
MDSELIENNEQIQIIEQHSEAPAEEKTETKEPAKKGHKRQMARKIITGLGSFISKRKEDMDKRKAFIKKADKLLYSYKEDALNELDRLPEEATNEIVQIIDDFKLAAGKLKDEHRKLMQAAKSSGDMLKLKNQLKSDIDKLGSDYINDIVEIFSKVNSDLS